MRPVENREERRSEDRAAAARGPETEASAGIGAEAAVTRAGSAERPEAAVRGAGPAQGAKAALSGAAAASDARRLPPDALLLAPMVELSHRALRELILEFGGLDLAYTEMASSGAAISGGAYEKWYLDSGPDPSRTILQFYTLTEERLATALKFVADNEKADAPLPGSSAYAWPLFGIPVYGADINFGCAAPQIRRAGGGVAWMSRPAEAIALARAARSVWPRPRSLSAKMRIGEDEDYPALLDFCRGLQEAGLDFITLHPRLAGEHFKRRARWEYVGRLSRDLAIPVVGNGDIHTYNDYLSKRRIASEAGAAPAGVMIGRGAATRPWIFALIRGREQSSDFALQLNLRDIAHHYLDLVETRLPADFHLSRARRFFYYYTDNFSWAHQIKWKLENCTDIQGMHAALEDYFAEVPGDKIKTDRD